MNTENKHNENLLTPDITHLFDIFDNRIRLVGGCVRDFVMQKDLHDYDFATPLTPQEVLEILKKNNIAVYTTGLQHGTVTAVYKHIPYEITTLRKDTRTDGRHATVAFVPDYESDSKRRDFTMNALYMDKNGVISDYTNGLNDIVDKRVRFIGDANQRVQEDYLRILRYFRFLSYFGTNKIDSDSLNACRQNRIGLKQISIERIREEILRLLSKPFVIEALRLMRQSRVAEVIFPACDVDRLERFITIYPKSDALERLVILTNETNKIDWKWSREQQKRLALYALPISFDAPDNIIKHMLWKIGKEAFLFHLAKAETDGLLTNERKSELENWEMPIFPIQGKDLMSIGFRGADISLQLKEAENLWVKIGLPNEKKLVIEYLLDYNNKSS